MSVRLRLMGTREEISAVLPALEQVLDVLETSRFYANRDSARMGRVYLEIEGVRTPVVRADTAREDTGNREITGRPAIERRGGGDVE